MSELQQKALEACWRYVGGVRASAQGGQVVLTLETKKAPDQPSRAVTLAKKSDENYKRSIYFVALTCAVIVSKFYCFGKYTEMQNTDESQPQKGKYLKKGKEGIEDVWRKCF